MSDNQIKQMQIAIAQTLKDLGAVGPQNDQKLVTASKLGTLESLKEAGILKKMQGPNADPGMSDAEAQQKIIDDMVKIYKDSPPDIRRQIEENLGMQPSVKEVVAPVQADTASKIHGIATTEKDPQDVTQERDLKEREMKVKEKTAQQKAATAK
jgi:hypothetical protein